MSQTASVMSANPTLETALGSLELDLESELRRYRRYLVADGQRNDSVATPKPYMAANQVVDPSDALEVAVETEKRGLDSSFETVSLPTPENPATHSPEVLQALESLQQSHGNRANEELLNLEHRDVLPQDYLDSSEELLRNLERNGEPEAATTSPRIQWTPLKASLVAAGIVGACILVFLILFPNIFNSSASQDATGLEPSDSSVTGGDGFAPAPTTINLASEEFVDLSLDNLSVVSPDEEVAIAPTAPTTNSAPTAVASPVPQPGALPDANAIPDPLVPPTGRENLASALLPPSLRPQPVTPFPVTPQIAGTTTAANGETLVTPDGLKVGYYYVIFRNTTPDALTRAKAQVKDAFVRTFPNGRAVQLAEVATADAAASLVQKYNNAQIAAEIYHHQLTPAP